MKNWLALHGIVSVQEMVYSGQSSKVNDPSLLIQFQSQQLLVISCKI